MHMEITPDIIQKALKKLQPDMSSGPDGVTPVPGCLSWQETLSSHLYCQSLPQARHPRTVLLILTSSHYTRAMMKLNYRPISLLCVRGKIMGSCIAATVTSHLRENDPSNQSMGVQERPFN